ncbi:hypothetical protein BS17DRAFT_764139 [Gyrodon lividus]|nr:hypothetical protein BS17DRAFT_764139 [Gyrodon lividus]
MASTSIANTTPLAGSVKILTVGSAVGSIRDLFAKIRAIDAKHGDFFGPLQEHSAGKDDHNEALQLLGGTIPGMTLHTFAAPLKCYIMQGENPLPESVIEKYAKTGGELCKDIFLLNKSGVITTAHGLRIACLGGIYNPGIYSSSEGPPGFASPFYTTHTLERLLSNTLVDPLKRGNAHNYGSLAAIRDAASTSQLVDILISSDWPASITSHTAIPQPSPEFGSSGSPPLDEIIRKTKPKYHFAGGGGRPSKFWEREPFVWDDEAGRVSRFVSLGAFGGEQCTGKKQRWFYAFSITPSAAAAAMQRPSNATKNPFTEAAHRPRKRSHETGEGENFIFGNVQQPGKRSRTEMQTGQKGKPPPGYKCKRCESTERATCARSATFPDTLFATVQPGTPWEIQEVANLVKDTCAVPAQVNYIILMTARWQINGRRMARGGKEGPQRKLDRTNAGFVYRIPTWRQIIPTQSAPDEGSVTCVPGGGHVLIVPISHQPTYNTIPNDIAPPILDETEKYKAALRGFFAKHGAVAVVYEVARLSAKGGHAHVQVVPVPILLQNKVEDAFLQEGRALGIDFEQDADGALEACAGGTRSYFRVDLPDGRKLVHLMKDHVPFSVQFGRLDWKACMLPEEEDKADVELFKKAFAAFDPSL